MRMPSQCPTLRDQQMIIIIVRSELLEKLIPNFHLPAKLANFVVVPNFNINAGMM